MAYKFIHLQESTLDKLTDLINKNLDGGWDLHGGISQHTEPTYGTVYHQFMRKRSLMSKHEESIFNKLPQYLRDDVVDPTKVASHYARQWLSRCFAWLDTEDAKRKLPSYEYFTLIQLCYRIFFEIVDGTH